MVAVPALFPVTVEPETEAIEELLDWKLPPVKPLGAEAVEVWPTMIVEGERLTVPLGQEPAVTVYVTVAIWGELSALESEMVIVQLKLPILEGASTVTVTFWLLPALILPELKLR